MRELDGSAMYVVAVGRWVGSGVAVVLPFDVVGASVVQICVLLIGAVCHAD